MRRSGWFDRDAAAPDIATGYTKHQASSGADTAAWRDNMYFAPARGSSAGGGESTASDMLAFALALERGKLLDVAGTRSIVAGPLGVARKIRGWIAE